MESPAFKMQMILAYTFSCGGLSRRHIVIGHSKPTRENMFRSRPQVACEWRTPYIRGSALLSFDGKVEIGDLKHIGCPVCLSLFVQSRAESDTTRNLLYFLHLLSRNRFVGHPAIKDAVANIEKQLLLRSDSDEEINKLMSDDRDVPYEEMLKDVIWKHSTSRKD